MSVKLFNKGQRTITHVNFDLKPNNWGSFTPEVADKLKRLYPDELMSVEDEIKKFDEAEAPVAASAPAKGNTPAKAAGGKTKAEQ